MSAEMNDEKSIFNEARKIDDATERENFLQRVCADNPDAIKRIRDLLNVHSAEQSFLESPAVELEQTIDTPLNSEKIGGFIGPYKLLEEIGEGGMGTVWVAQQSKPIKRRVAIKLIKAGMDSKSVLARFEAERQALAMMDHPNIARVLDGGMTDQGRPYFAMELVRGIPIRNTAMTTS